jgi:GTP-binding protein EngB required for normal cell division
MHTTSDTDELIRIVDEFSMLVQETAEYQSRGEIRTLLEHALRDLIKTRQKLERSLRRYVVAVVGLANVGKSTLLNALIGSDLAPRRNRPCTAVPVEFAYGDAYRITTYYRNQLVRPTRECLDADDVHAQLAALVDDNRSIANRSIFKLIVEAPHPLLASGLIVADTPGFGAVQEEAADTTHEDALRNYLQTDVSQVFWVVLAEQGIGKREVDFHDQFFADVCDDVVVTGSEDWGASDRDRFRKRFARSFGQRMPAFHFVSGLNGLKAREGNDSAALETAGITLLEKRIRELAEPAGRMVSLRSAILGLATDLGYWIHESIGRSSHTPAEFWRPDSWDRWQLSLPNDPVVLAISRKLQISPTS